MSEDSEISPPLSDYDPWKVGQPEDGVIWQYKSDVDGLWRIITDEDFALEEATGYPVGELVDQEAMGDYTESESGELRAIFVPPANPEPAEDAVMAIRNARSLLSDFEDADTEIRHGAIKHAIAELQNARRALPDEY